MRRVGVTAAVLVVACLYQSVAEAAALAKINIQLTATVVSQVCVVSVDDQDKTVELGRWATKQLRPMGATTTAIPFSIALSGCPQGPVSISFQGVAVAGQPDLLALNAASTATNVAVELRDLNNERLPLGSYSPEVQTDAKGDATLKFFANYIATADDASAGAAVADATFLIQYD